MKFVEWAFTHWQFYALFVVLSFLTFGTTGASGSYQHYIIFFFVGLFLEGLSNLAGHIVLTMVILVPFYFLSIRKTYKDKKSN